MAKATIVFLELPDFKKQANELETDYERWLYVLKHLANLKEMPETLKRNKIFKKLFMEAEIANMTQEELDKYDKSLKKYSNMYTTKHILNDWKREFKREIGAVRKEWKREVGTLQQDNAAKAQKIAEYERKYGAL